MCKDCGCCDDWDEGIEEQEDEWYDIGETAESFIKKAKRFLRRLFH